MNELIKTPLNLTDAAEQINHHHQLAMDNADKAITHAVTIGNLLLEVKSNLPHGQYTPWIENHLEVSPRQARRYVDAALGKEITPRQIKSDTVSVLDQLTKPVSTVNLLPEPGSLLEATLDETPGDSAWIMIQESSRHPGYVNYLYMDGSVAEFSRRGCQPDRLGYFLKNYVIHQRYIKDGIDSLAWRLIPASPDCLESWISNLKGAA